MKRLLVLLLAVSSGAACAVAQREPAFRGLPPDDAGSPLSAVWIGHATVLLRLGDQLVLTDPNLNGALLVVPRETPASIVTERLPFVDAAIVSHMHFDHFDRPTIRKLRPATALFYPAGGEPYAGSLPQRRREPMDAWETARVGALTITAVPVSHFGGRYGLDALWNHAYTGYVIEGHGVRVFFAGDTGWHPALFKEVGRRFPGIDVAFVPIAPYRADRFGSPIHANPSEALAIMQDVGARHMIPIHYEAYYGSWSGFDRPRRDLERAARSLGLQGSVHALRTGERWSLPTEAVAGR